MAATTNRLPAVNFVLKAGGNLIGGGTSDGLVMGMSPIPITNKTKGRVTNRIHGERFWRFTFQSDWLENSLEVSGENMALALSNGTATYGLKGLQNLELALSCALADVADTEDAFWMAKIPGFRSGSLTARGNYYDPLSTGGEALGLLQALVLGTSTTALDAAIGFGNGLTGTAQSGGASTITLATGASASDDTYNDMVIVITGGTGSGQTAIINDYTGSSREATVADAWGVQPDNTSTYRVLSSIRLSILPSEIQVGQATTEGAVPLSVTAQNKAGIQTALLTADTGIAAVLAAILATGAATAVTGLFQSVDNSGTPDAENQEWTGSGYLSQVTITVPRTTQATISGTLEGSGALTAQATT